MVFKWEKNFQIIVKMEFLTHLYSIFLEFVVLSFM